MRLILTSVEHRGLWRHLLQRHRSEEAAFILATEHDGSLTPLEIIRVPAGGFSRHSRFGLELTDEYRASIIKQAHDRNAMIIEFHSHPFPVPAAFSLTDISGLEEFVPHVRWRLKGKPYAAVVVGPTSFDAVIWRQNGPEPLIINVGKTTLLPTRGTEWNHGSF